jgi:hypothetical protein
MGDWGLVVGSLIAVVAMAAGYFIGFRNGQVAGELAALKAHRSGGRRRERRDGTTNGDDES